MFEDEQGRDGLERELADLGPLMVEQERLEAVEPDPVFRAELRARLVEMAGLRAPEPARSRRPALRLIRPRGWRRPQWAGWGAAAFVAAAAALLIFLRTPQRHPSPGVPTAAWYPPTPNSQDLTKSYPLLGGLGGGGMANPIVPVIEYAMGGPYPGHLQISGGAPPLGPAHVTAYRLRGPAFDVPRVRQLARLLGISGPVKRLRGFETIGGAREQSTWVAVAHGGGAYQPLHSVAVSVRSGQLIYHDFSLASNPSSSARRPDPASAIAAARSWLTRLGWPGATMPVQPVRYMPPGPDFLPVSFGWPRVGPADLPAATLWVVRGGRISEALLLPPVENSRVLSARPLAAAWTQLQAGRVPIGVENMMVAQPPNGAGTLRSVTAAHVFTSTSRGDLYLVPVYRFAGTALFPHVAGTRRWFALAPAIRSTVGKR